MKLSPILKIIINYIIIFIINFINKKKRQIITPKANLKKNVSYKKTYAHSISKKPKSTLHWHFKDKSFDYFK